MKIRTKIITGIVIILITLWVIGYRVGYVAGGPY